MRNDDDLALVAQMVALNEGRLVGRTRFQKTVYLLRKLGLNLPFEFEYHYYGPYSLELADAIQAASETGRLKEDFGSGYHGTAYSIFTTDIATPTKIANVNGDQVRGWLSRLAHYTGTDLELASTILFLKDECNVPANLLEEELTELKPVKASPERLTRAWHLLNALGLASNDSLSAKITAEAADHNTMHSE